MPKLAYEFVTVSTATRKLSLTEDHMLPVVACTDVSSLSIDTYMQNSRPSGTVQPGECLLRVVDGKLVSEQVTEVARERQVGIYAPVTEAGSIIVNDVVASCYSGYFSSHRIQHALFKMMERAADAFNAVAQMVSTCSQGTEFLRRADGDIPMVLRFLLKASDLVSFKA
jgi:hypothetical protein